MKKILLVLVVSLFSACKSERPDMNTAIKITESAIKLLGDKNFDELTNLCTTDFKEGEPKEAKEKKYTQLIDLIGKTETSTLIDSSRASKEEINMIVLKYAVKHTNATTTETYTVIEEDGKSLIADIYITNK